VHEQTALGNNKKKGAFEIVNIQAIFLLATPIDTILKSYIKIYIELIKNRKKTL